MEIKYTIDSTKYYTAIQKYYEDCSTIEQKMFKWKETDMYWSCNKNSAIPTHTLRAKTGTE